MEEKQIVSLYVATDSEHRELADVYDGLYDVSEALETFKIQPVDNKPSIGVKIHKWGSKAASDIMIDIVIGEKIYLESLEYLPGVMRSEKVFSYIAELLAYLPSVPVSGKIPDEVADLVEKYAISYKNREHEKQKMLLEKLGNLTVDALKFAKSPKRDEQRYAEALLQYASEQKEMIQHGAKEIDLQKLPLKEKYICDNFTESVVDTKKSIARDEVQNSIYKEGSLLGKLYKYQQSIQNDE